MMPIADDIRGIADRANRELDAVHDFFEFSKVAWRAFGSLVDEGRRIVATNAATGTTHDQNGLLGLAPHYHRAYLAVFTFRQFVSIFEVFLFDLLHRVLLHNPWQLSRTQLDFEVVLKAGDREEVISAVLLKQLNQLRYEKLRDWFDALNKAVKLDCPSDDEIDALAEVKATRDVLEHNAGVVNDVYLRKAGKKARHALGDRVEIDDNYHLESWRLIKKAVADLSGVALARLAPPAAPTP
jgi:hypothetical protein